MQSLALGWKRSSLSVALVPTMGALHAGHLSLIKRACQSVQLHGKVVVSIFVNPLQFTPNEDFKKYPRDLKNDLRQCQEAGADAVFTPSSEMMYPYEGDSFRPELKHSTFVYENTLTRPMEGVTRPLHFRGVTTIVAKLFNITLPDYAVFGEKDFQQAAIIQRMVRDLNFPTQIVVAPIVREADGLALSSRNRYLSPSERKDALSLIHCIQAAREKVAQTIYPAEALRKELKKRFEKIPSAKVDYIEFYNSDTLTPVDQVKPGVRIGLAVYIGKTRLIDNGIL